MRAYSRTAIRYLNETDYSGKHPVLFRISGHEICPLTSRQAILSSQLFPNLVELGEQKMSSS